MFLCIQELTWHEAMILVSYIVVVSLLRNVDKYPKIGQNTPEMSSYSYPRREHQD